MDALKIISEGSIKAEKPQFNVGDTVRVDVRIKEGERERIQAFEGTVIAKKHGGVAETCISAQRPVVVFTRTIDTFERLFMKQYTETMTAAYLTH